MPSPLRLCLCLRLVLLLFLALSGFKLFQISNFQSEIRFRPAIRALVPPPPRSGYRLSPIGHSRKAGHEPSDCTQDWLQFSLSLGERDGVRANLSIRQLNSHAPPPPPPQI